MELIGLVLAGGKSTRMQKDKGAIRIHGKSQVETCVELLKPFCKSVFVSKRAGQPTDAATLIDAKDFSDIGPMAGLLTALKQFPESAILAVAIDLPLLDNETLKFLIKHRNPKKAATAFISSSDGMPEPLCTIYEPSAFPLMIAFKNAGKSCPRKFLLNHDVELLKQLNPQALFNMNTPEDLAVILAKSKALQ